MSENDKIVIPEELRTDFLKTGDLVFQDCSRVTAGEIWRFMTEEAPSQYPYAYDRDPKVFSMSRVSLDVENFSSLRRIYLYLTLKDRVLAANRNGKPFVYIGMGQSLEPYHAAGTIPVRHPVFILLTQNTRGATADAFSLDRQKAYLEGQKKFPEGCVAVGSYQAMFNGDLPIKLIAPYLCTRCSDVVYLAEQLSRNDKKIPTYFVDFPLTEQRDTEWGVEYVATNLRRLTEKLGALTGRTVTEDELQEEIKQENTGRGYLREYMNAWWSATEPPTTSYDHVNMPFFTKDFLPDPLVVTQIIKETRDLTRQRVKDNFHAPGVAEDPVRLVICGPGSIAIPPFMVDKLGGLLVARDEYWSETQVHVKETGDPYENLARSFITLPFEQPTEKRAEYVVDLVRKSRADGLLFNYGWGCSYQSSVARMVCDIVRNETGIPAAVLNQGATTPNAQEANFTRIEAYIEMLKGSSRTSSKVSLSSDPIMEIIKG